MECQAPRRVRHRLASRHEDSKRRVRRALAQPGISLLPLDADTAAESTLLPGEPHVDPADRFLIAAARTKGLVLATRDEAIIDYGDAGHVRVLDL